MNKLIVGMPAGSLANPARGGNLVQLLEHAGFKTSGYEAGGPSKFSTTGFLVGWDGRPQEFGSQLGLNEIDVAIAGDDWIRERVLELRLEYGQTLAVEKVLSLKRGSVRIVGIADQASGVSPEAFFANLAANQPLITVVSEMPYLALDWVQSCLKKSGVGERYSRFSVQKYKTPPRITEGIVIYETWGKTEAKVKNGGAHLGLEITQSGSAIRNYGLDIIDTVMESETGIWINPALKHDPLRADLLRMFLLNMYGVVNAENKVMILFNVPNSQVGEVEAFLSRNNLYADEPTKTKGEAFTEFSIQVDIMSREVPLAQIRYELARRQATSINTIPIDSSIPGMEVLGF